MTDHEITIIANDYADTRAARVAAWDAYTNHPADTARDAAFAADHAARMAEVAARAAARAGIEKYGGELPEGLAEAFGPPSGLAYPNAIRVSADDPSYAGSVTGVGIPHRGARLQFKRYGNGVCDRDELSRALGIKGIEKIANGGMYASGSGGRDYHGFEWAGAAPDPGDLAAQIAAVLDRGFELVAVDAGPAVADMIIAHRLWSELVSQLPPETAARLPWPGV